MSGSDKDLVALATTRIYHWKVSNPDDQAATRAAFPVFLRAGALLVERLDRQLQVSVGIHLTWYEVLAQLSSAKGGRMPMKQLADSVMLSKSGITRLVDRMERAGLVERHSCSNDGRVCFARLTRRGLAVLQTARPVAAQGVEEHFARHLTGDEARVMTTALQRVLEAAGRAPEHAEPLRDKAEQPLPTSLSQAL